MRKFNDWLAVKLTLAFGSMGTWYLFLFYGLLPLIPIFTRHESEFLYWSNYVQLFALPLLMVGQNILGKTTEARNQEMYKLIKESHAALLAEIQTLKEIRHDEERVIEDIEKDSSDAF